MAAVQEVPKRAVAQEVMQVLLVKVVISPAMAAVEEEDGTGAVQPMVTTVEEEDLPILAASTTDPQSQEMHQCLTLLEVI